MSATAANNSKLVTRNSPLSISGQGQSTIEYAVVIGMAVAALLAMAAYIKRGISGKLRVAADSIGEPYEPRRTDGVSLTRATSATLTVVQELNEVDLNTSISCAVDSNGDGDCEDPGEVPLPVPLPPRCVDLDDPPDGRCDNPNVFATRSTAILLNEESARDADEIVGPLGKDLWN